MKSLFALLFALAIFNICACSAHQNVTYSGSNVTTRITDSTNDRIVLAFSSNAIINTPTYIGQGSQSSTTYNTVSVVVPVSGEVVTLVFTIKNNVVGIVPLQARLYRCVNGAGSPTYSMVAFLNSGQRTVVLNVPPGSGQLVNAGDTLAIFVTSEGSLGKINAAASIVINSV